MSIIEELENINIYILENLFDELNRLDIVGEEIGESVNAKYFAIGCYKEDSNSRCKSVIISDVIKLNLMIWNKSIMDFIEDVMISLPVGFTIIGSIESKLNNNEWCNFLRECENSVNKSVFWKPDDYLNFVIIPKSNNFSVISSLNIFLVKKNANYLIPDTRISIINDILNFGKFISSEVQISVPLLNKDNETSFNLSLIKDIIETNLIVHTSRNKNDMNNIYCYNKNYKIRLGDRNILPIQLPVYFSQNKKILQNDDNNLNPHFFSCYTITNNDDKNIKNINLHLQACIFRLNNEMDLIQEYVKRCFINQCNYIEIRMNNPTPLFYYNLSILSKINNKFEYYMFKLPNISIPVVILNTGLLFDDIPEQKIIRKYWSEVFNIKPLMPFITKNLALISKINKDEYSNKYYQDKIISPHLLAIEKIKLRYINKNDNDLDYNLIKFERHIIYQIVGDFYYFHYNQEELKDNGWGCTYRSLQMVLSWYLINNYTNKHILSIIEIQKFLKLNDNTHHNLQIGSNTWIGTIEASYLLMIYLGISCKLKYFYSIDEFLENFELFSDHFQKIGTPIIISIGNYSYLMVAIHISKKASSPIDINSIQYLLVDPHYIGKDDDLEYIYKKNGVNWRSSSFFKNASQNKYVNVLFPLNISEKDSQIIY